MATGFVAGLLVAFFGAAVGAVFGQFLRYYRRRKREVENLITVIEWIDQLTKDEIGEAVDDPDSHVWKLRDSLYEASEANHQFLNDDAKDSIRGIFSILAKMRDMDGSWIAEQYQSSLLMYTYSALDEIDEISIWQCARQFFTGSQ